MTGFELHRDISHQSSCSDESLYESSDHHDSLMAIASSFPSHPDIWKETLGWCPSDRQQQQFQHLYHQICVGNQSLNLTRITQPDEFWEKHLWDSLSGIHFLLTEKTAETIAAQAQGYGQTDNSVEPRPDSVADSFADSVADPVGDQADGQATDNIEPQIERVLDIGTGAGFPGLPVAIACPHWQLTLLDSTRKKIAFIDSILPRLDLTNVHTFTHRAEALGRNSHHRYQYDLVLVRAVAAATVCAEYALPFLKVGGRGVLYRGRWTEAEEESLAYALDLLGGTIESIYQWETPLSQGDRHCVVIRKIAKTPRFFPRDIGVPAKDPLA